MPKKKPQGLVESRTYHIPERIKKLIVFFTASRFIQLFGFILILILCLSFGSSPFFKRIDAAFYDSFLKTKAETKLDSSIVYIAIDRKSIQAIPKFPWPRTYHAKVTKALRTWGAQAIFFNMFFRESSDLERDEFLIEEFKQTDNLYLPVSYETLSPSNYLLSKSDEVFSEHAKAIGHVVTNLDGDGTVRRFSPFLKSNGDTFPHTGLQIAYDLMDETLPKPGFLDLPHDENGDILISWAEKWSQTSQYVSFLDVLNSITLISQGKDPIVNPASFDGKICLIGFTATGYKDFLKTPLEPDVPAIAVLGNIINTILTRQYIHPLSPGLRSFLLVCVMMGCMLILMPFRGILSFLGTFFLGLLWVMVSFVLLSFSGIWIGVSVPIILIFFLHIFSWIHTKVVEYKKKDFLLDLYMKDELTGLYERRYLPTLLKNAVKYSRTFRRPFSIIMIDIDNFKEIIDKYGHHATDHALSRIGEVIQESIRTTKRAVPDAGVRYSIEEFALVLSGANLPAATFNVAERIRKTIEQSTFHHKGQDFTMTMSLGVSVLRKGEKRADQVLERAGQALDRAQNSGKNQTCLI